MSEEKIKDLEQTNKQLSINADWLRERFDALHELLCAGKMGTWQDRVKQVMEAVIELDTHYGESYPYMPRFQCCNARYFVVVQRYTFEQFRLQLCDKEKPDSSGYDNSSIVREMCTYEALTAVETMQELMAAYDPAQKANEMAKPWNCEYEGGRIRLDNKEKAAYGQPGVIKQGPTLEDVKKEIE